MAKLEKQQLNGRSLIAKGAVQPEEWRPVPGYEGRYEVSSIGRVKRLARFMKNRWGTGTWIKEKILRQYLSCYGYLQVSLTDEYGKVYRCGVHHIMAMAFLPCEGGKNQVNHLNEIKTDNRIENLEWCTAGHNINWGTRNSRVADKLGRPIMAIRIKDGAIFKFASLSEARARGFSPNRVSQHNTIRYAGTCRYDEYVWMWQDDEDKTLPAIIDKRKSIEGISVNDGSVIIFASIREANRNGFCRDSVRKAISCGNIYKGYSWNIKK